MKQLIITLGPGWPGGPCGWKTNIQTFIYQLFIWVILNDDAMKYDTRVTEKCRNTE